MPGKHASFPERTRGSTTQGGPASTQKSANHTMISAKDPDGNGTESCFGFNKDWRESLDSQGHRGNTNAARGWLRGGSATGEQPNNVDAFCTLRKKRMKGYEKVDPEFGERTHGTTWTDTYCGSNCSHESKRVGGSRLRTA